MVEMGAYLKPVVRAISKASDKQFENLSEKIGSARQKRKDAFVEKCNEEAARKHAILLGLKSIHDQEVQIRKLLNEKIIQIKKSKRLKHNDIAIAGRTARTRITAILNRHIDEVSIDAMIILLGIFGASVKIEITDPE